MSRLECMKTNPMKNDLILERLFQFCDVPTLKSCRLVSLKWRNLSLKAWRAKAVVQLATNHKEKLEVADFLKLVDSKLQFKDSSLQLRKYPFKRYSVEFEKCFVGGGDIRNRMNLATVISNSGATHMEIFWEEQFNSLHLLLSELNKRDSLESLEVNWETLASDVPEWMPPMQFSNLRRLKLFAFKMNSEHSNSRSLWPSLLKWCPKLEALSVAYDFRNEDGSNYYLTCLLDRMELTKFLMTMRHAGGENILPLKELEMMDVHSMQRDGSGVEAVIINNLTECKFPLERLSIHVGWNDCDEEDIVILTLLESCTDTLQYLKASINLTTDSCNATTGSVGDYGRRIRTRIKPYKTRKTVRMEALKEIYLVNGLEWAMFLLSHLELPNLEKLTVAYDKKRNHEKRSGKTSVYIPPGIVYDKLQRFDLYDNQKIPGDKTIRKLAKMMPNLTHLTIAVDKLSFPVICTHFKGLKSLNIMAGEGDYEELDDEALTGISVAELKEGGVPSARRPNITDLEHLTEIQILCHRQMRRNDVKFTEHSVIYGFLQLPRLYYLSLAIKELSEEIKEKLVRHVKGGAYLQTLKKPAPTSFDLEVVSDTEVYSSSSDDDEN